MFGGLVESTFDKENKTVIKFQHYFTNKIEYQNNKTIPIRRKKKVSKAKVQQHFCRQLFR